MKAYMGVAGLLRLFDLFDVRERIGTTDDGFGDVILRHGFERALKQLRRRQLREEHALERGKTPHIVCGLTGFSLISGPAHAHLDESRLVDASGLRELF